MREEWRTFKGTKWTDDINVRDFIQNNYTPYSGDESFLEGPTEATAKLWDKIQELQKEERARGGVLECETEVVSGLTSYGPGYIDPEHKELEKVVGLQTDKPLKRAFMPYGGIKMAEEAAENYGFHINDKFHKIFNEYHKTHNQAVFDAYTPEMKRARHSHIVTGLPDTYGRGRIVGDYRRVALYGIDFLVEKKREDFDNCGDGTMTDDEGVCPLGSQNPDEPDQGLPPGHFQDDIQGLYPKGIQIPQRSSHAYERKPGSGYSYRAGNLSSDPLSALLCAEAGTLPVRWAGGSPRRSAGKGRPPVYQLRPERKISGPENQ